MIIFITDEIVIIIDDEDEDLLEYSWNVHNGCAWRGKRIAGIYHNIYMHRVILERKLGRSIEKNEVSDHINRHPWDNRRENLRVATWSVSNRNRNLNKNNTSGFRAVWKSRKKWWSMIEFEGERIYLGMHDTPEEASKAHSEKYFELSGEFPPEIEGDQNG